MRITTEQLRAIEKAIGHEAKAWVDTGSPMRGNPWDADCTTIGVSAVHQGQTVRAQMALTPYPEQEALEYIAGTLVRRINEEILVREFSYVRW